MPAAQKQPQAVEHKISSCGLNKAASHKKATRLDLGQASKPISHVYKIKK